MRTYILSALCAMSALPAMVVASTQSFEVGPVWQGTPINGGNVFEFEITDPATNNSTDCIVEFASNSPPPGWVRADSIRGFSSLLTPVLTDSRLR